MALRQYGIATKERIEQETDIYATGTETLCSWRDRLNLDSWFTKLYSQKGGVGQDLCSILVKLSVQDLDRLEQAIKQNDLSSIDDLFCHFNAYDSETGLDFISTAKAKIKEGYTVYYYSCM